MAKNFYDILGVSKTATQDEIKKEYREWCKKYNHEKMYIQKQLKKKKEERVERKMEKRKRKKRRNMRKRKR